LLPFTRLGQLVGALSQLLVESGELGRAAGLGVGATGFAEAARALVQLPRRADHDGPDQ
jgi:hypothetical protein